MLGGHPVTSSKTVPIRSLLHPRSLYVFVFSKVQCISKSQSLYRFTFERLWYDCAPTFRTVGISYEDLKSTPSPTTQSPGDFPAQTHTQTHKQHHHQTHKHRGISPSTHTNRPPTLHHPPRLNHQGDFPCQTHTQRGDNTTNNNNKPRPDQTRPDQTTLISTGDSNGAPPPPGGQHNQPEAKASAGDRCHLRGGVNQSWT